MLETIVFVRYTLSLAPEKAEKIRQIIKELDYKPNSIGQGLVIRKKNLKFSFFIPDTNSHPFFVDVLKGAKRKAVELEQYGIKVMFHIMDFKKQAVDLEGFETDGLVLVGTADACTLELADWARENGRPVVCYNIPLPDSNYLAYVGCDYIQAGKLAAGLCALISDGKGKVGIISEDDGKVLSFRQRVLGFRKEVNNKYPDMEILDVYTAGVGSGGIREAVCRMLWEHPEMNTVYFINPGDYSACKMIHDAAQHPKVKIITNDLTEGQRQMVKNETITAAICQEPEKQGALPLEILFQYVVNGIIPEEKDIFVTLSIHIAQNV